MTKKILNNKLTGKVARHQRQTLGTSFALPRVNLTHMVFLCKLQLPPETMSFLPIHSHTAREEAELADSDWVQQLEASFSVTSHAISPVPPQLAIHSAECSEELGFLLHYGTQNICLQFKVSWILCWNSEHIGEIHEPERWSGMGGQALKQKSTGNGGEKRNLQCLCIQLKGNDKLQGDVQC